MTDNGEKWTPEMVGEVLADALGVSDAAAVVEADELRERLESSLANRTGRVGLDCPGCGRTAAMRITGGQAFCDEGDCDMFSWDPDATFEEMAAEGVHVVDLRGWLPGPG
jgi:hypothetical protein